MDSVNLPNSASHDLNIPLVIKEKRTETQNCLSIVFERPRGLTYKAGNWMDIRFFSADLSIGKTFSFSSSPTEPDIMITFKKGMSKFKKTLEKVSIGDTMFITQYGSNGFLLNKRHPSVLIAGGIGITPFRSMIKEAIDTDSKAEITLIYQSHIDAFPFHKELAEWEKSYSFLKVHFIVTGKQGRLTK